MQLVFSAFTHPVNQEILLNLDFKILHFFLTGEHFHGRKG